MRKALYVCATNQQEKSKMTRKTFVITYNTGGAKKKIVVYSVSERNLVLSYMKKRRLKDGYTDIVINEVAPKKQLA